MKSKALTFLLVTGFFLSALSQTYEPCKNKIPTFNGHRFVTTSFATSSFITTSLQADIGVGTTSLLKIPGIVIDDYEILAFEGRIFFFDLNVQYQQRFTPWLSMFFAARTSGRIGADMSTIVADGVNTLSGLNMGWLIRIKKTEKLNLSGTVFVNNLSGNFINIKEYFRELINNEPYPSLSKTVPAMSIGTGLRAAYAFNRMFGVQIQLDYGYGESFDRTKTKGFYNAGLCGDIDFSARYHVPLGFMLGYNISTAPAIIMKDTQPSNLFTGKLVYSGSNDFELGIQFTYYNMRINSVGKKPFISKAILAIKFYF